MKIRTLATAVGLAVSATAMANNTPAPVSGDLHSFELMEMQTARQAGFPRAATSDGREAVSVDIGTPLKASGVRLESPFGRGMGPNMGAFTDLEEEEVTPGATLNFHFPATSFFSPDMGDDIWFRLTGQIFPYARIIDLSGSPLGGPNGVTNSSKTIQLFTNAVNPPGFYGGFALTLVNENNELDKVLTPSPDTSTRVSAEIYMTTLADTRSFEPVAVRSGFITGRLLWGGECAETEPGDCDAWGGPGLRTTFGSLGPDPDFWNFGQFFAARYCVDLAGNPIPGCVPPPGASVGDTVPVPVGSWFQLAGESTVDARMEFYVDRLNGQGEFLIYSHQLLTSALLDRLSANMGLDNQGSAAYYDNVEFSGDKLIVPQPPALECDGTYMDDMEYLNVAPLLAQTPRWWAALSSGASVIWNTGAMNNKVIEQANTVAPTNQYREEVATQVPAVFPTAGNPWEACVDVRTSGGTVRGFSPKSPDANAFPTGHVTRVFFGNQPPAGFYEPSIYVQTDPTFNPVDEDGGDPAAPEGVIQPGVNVADTGADWANDNVFRTLCIAVDIDGNMTVSLNGTQIYAGSAFVNTLGNSAAAPFTTGYVFESENNIFGENSDFRIDDFVVNCGEPPVVAFPPLTLPYTDTIDTWGIVGLPPDAHVDAEDESRWPVTAPGVQIGSTNFPPLGMTLAICAENVFRDTEQEGLPDTLPTLFEQARSVLPHVDATAVDGYTVTSDNLLTDFATTRTWSIGQLSDVAGQLNLNSRLHFRAATQTFAITGGDPMNSEANVTLESSVTPGSAGVVANQWFEVEVSYDADTDMFTWSVNGTEIGSALPTNSQGVSGFRPNRNLDYFFISSGDDITAPEGSIHYVDNLRAEEEGGAAPCPGDATGDGIVNFSDLNAVLNTFGQTGPGLIGDVTGDMVVNFSDLNLVLNNFGNNCN